MELARRTFLHLTTGATAFWATSRIGHAADYPARTARIFVGFPAGTSSDITARLIGQWLSDRLGQQFVVDNRVGAGSNIAAEFVVRSPPDGYTLVYATPPNAIFSSCSAWSRITQRGPRSTTTAIRPSWRSRITTRR